MSIKFYNGYVGNVYGNGQVDTSTVAVSGAPIVGNVALQGFQIQYGEAVDRKVESIGIITSVGDPVFSLGNINYQCQSYMNDLNAHFGTAQVFSLVLTE